jgi:uncharacterized coiled-coil protein SlyX
MWLLHFFPDWLIQFIVHTILILGVVGCLITFQFANKVLMTWPPLAAYYKMAQIASVVLLVCGIYFEGGYSAEMQWRERVREVEAKVAQAEQAANEANKALAKKSKEKVKIIEGKQVIVKQYIDREVAKYNDQCVIPKEFVKAHNDSAEKAK